MEEPQSFLDTLHDHTVALDEIHRLNNPSEILNDNVQDIVHKNNGHDIVQ